MDSHPFLIIGLCLSVYMCVTVQAAAVSTLDCEERLQTQLSELLATKQTCDSGVVQDCCQIKQLVPETPTGVYTLTFADQSPPSFSVTYKRLAACCDMETDGGGWTVIQRRVANGTVNFTRVWSDYVSGFGDVNGEFWYGLDNIQYLTVKDDVELRIDMVMEDDGSELTWTYQTFRVAGAEERYRLTIGPGVGTGHDAMAFHNGQQFSTYDCDNDQAGGSCAFAHQGGWWYKDCYHANLNGPHTIPPNPSVDQMHAKMMWLYQNNPQIWRDVSSSEIKIRKKNCFC